MWSANMYLAMSFYMEKEGFSGMAHWLKKQWAEENEHACAMADYVIKRGGKAKVDKLDVVPNDFGTPLEVFEQVYKHECRVSEMIDKLVDVAAAEKIKQHRTSCGDLYANRWKKRQLLRALLIWLRKPVQRVSSL